MSEINNNRKNIASRIKELRESVGKSVEQTAEHTYDSTLQISEEYRICK